MAMTEVMEAPVTKTTGEGAIRKLEKPKNGLAGLKYWRYDLRSGFMVALISLPFSMGIAITSGAPPVCGIVSAIIAGFLLPFLGGSYVTISGPAAGLAPVLFAGMIALGGGDLAIGYPRVLAAICVAGVLQLILSRCRVARLSAIFPAAAIEGMLAAIGLLIIVKQIPLFFGTKFEAHEFWAILEEVPSKLSALNPQVFGLGIACLVLIFGLSAVPGRLLKVMPPAVWAFFLGTIGARLFLSLDSGALINVPEAPLANGVVFPDFVGLLGDQSLWISAVLLVFTLVLIDGTESLATIAAVDKLDPFRRKSDPDRTLSAMGISNVASSMLGGLTIIPGIVKSTANILGGGRTQWANFYNACFLLTFLIFGRDLINMVPMCVLASILVFVGYKLCGPKVWRHVASIGKEQLAIFSVTVFVTVTTDLLVGIGVGVAMKYGLCLWHHLADAVARPSNPARSGSPDCRPLLQSNHQPAIQRRHLRSLSWSPGGVLQPLPPDSRDGSDPARGVEGATPRDGRRFHHRPHHLRESVPLPGTVQLATGKAPAGDTRVRGDARVFRRRHVYPRGKPQATTFDTPGK